MIRDQQPDRIIIPLALNAEDAVGARAGEQPWLIFPDKSGDPQNLASYDFAAADEALRKARETTALIGARVRLGALASGSESRMAAVLSRTVMHFYAEGSNQAITEWEFCADGPSGKADSTDADALELASRALKASMPTLSLGRSIDAGAGAEVGIAGAFDFFAWRFPAAIRDPLDAVRLAAAVRSTLDGAGQTKARLRLLNSDLAGDAASRDEGEKGALPRAAFLASVLLDLQDSGIESIPVDLWITATREAAEKERAVLHAAAEMRETPARLVVEVGAAGYAALAGLSDDRQRIQILIANYQGESPGDAKSSTEKEEGYDLEISGLPWGNTDFGVYRYRVDEEHNLDRISSGGGRGGILHLESRLPAFGVELVVLQQATRPVSDRLSRRRSRKQQ